MRRLTFRIPRNRVIFLRLIILSVALVPATLYFILAYIIPTNPALIPSSLLLSKRPVLVTAHPDDESLFFGPTVLGLVRSGETKDLRILVLSSGNNYGLGDTRKNELKEACERIGAKECEVLDRQDLKDSPTLWWDQAVLTPIITSWVAKWKADAVITFDAGGVSGHINHRAVSAAIIQHAKQEPEFPPTYVLGTVATFLPPRKYIGILDLPLTCFSFTWRIFIALMYSPRNHLWSTFDAKSWQAYDDRGLIVSSIWTWQANVRAFWAHSSQRSWDRWLYMIVSRYMWFNDIVKVETFHGGG